eukprot:gene30228-36768_t
MPQLRVRALFLVLITTTVSTTVSLLGGWMVYESSKQSIRESLDLPEPHFVRWKPLADAAEYNPVAMIWLMRTAEVDAGSVWGDAYLLVTFVAI